MRPLVFEPIYPNPYIAGNPVRSREMFFGREDEFRFIARALEEGRKTALIVLFGERRSGKSSILYQILNGRLGEAFLPIFVDMQIMAGIANDAEFFERIIADTCKQYARNGWSSERYAASFKETAAANVFRRFLQELKEHFPNRAPLLLVDEYENLEVKIKEGSLSRHIPTFFAGLLETDLVSFVFTGSKTLEAHDQTLWGEELFRKATSRKISFLTKDDATRLITQPVQNKVAFAPEALAQIYILAAGQPFYTQMICQNLVYHLNEVQKYDVTVEDVHTVVAGILENPPPQLLFNWGEQSSERKLALSALAEFAETPEASLSAGELCRKISRSKLKLDLDANFFNTEFSSLFQDEYLAQKGRQYAFRLDLYRQWVRHDHSIWQAKNEIGEEELAIITEQERKRKERRKRNLKILERSVEIGLTALALFFLAKFFLALGRHVIVRANGGPFSVWVDGDSLGATRGQKDSTRFEIPLKLTKGNIYEVQAVLLASGELWKGSIAVTKDDQEVAAGFSLYPFTVVTDAASIEVRLGEMPAVKTEADQPEAWQHTFNVCAGRYMLWARDRSSREVWQGTITASAVSNRVKVDFEQVVLITLAANLYPFEYDYRRSNSIKQEKGRADSARVLRGQPKGFYEFTFNKAGFETIKKNHLVETDTTIAFEFEPLVKALYTLHINSQPQGAKVFLREKPLGNTPCVVTRAAGNYSFTLKKDGYEPITKGIALTGNETLHILLKPILHTLRIESNPPGASVSLNGVAWRTTPCDTSLASGNYTITLSKEGYAVVTKSVMLFKDETLNLTLTPQFGYLKLVVQDELGRSLPDVRVFINNEYQGETPLQEIKLPAMRHVLRLERSGARMDTSFAVTKNDTTKLTLSMAKRL